MRQLPPAGPMPSRTGSRLDTTAGQIPAPRRMNALCLHNAVEYTSGDLARRLQQTAKRPDRGGAERATSRAAETAGKVSAGSVLDRSCTRLLQVERSEGPLQLGCVPLSGGFTAGTLPRSVKRCQNFRSFSVQVSWFHKALWSRSPPHEPDASAPGPDIGHALRISLALTL